MCGRYTLLNPEIIVQVMLDLGLDPGVAGKKKRKPRYNTAPTQTMPVIKSSATGTELVDMRWGIVPFYSRHDVKPMQLFNARSETAAEKPTFRQSVQRRRCVVPADGFFEWRKETDKSKTPFFIRLRGKGLFFIAGIFEDGAEPTDAGYALLTTGPNELMEPIHNRMPVILTPEHLKEWLTPGAISEERVRAICESYPANEMIADPVSTIVNKASNDVPECVIPVRQGEIQTEPAPDLFNSA